jgi:hypothetical protein
MSIPITSFKAFEVTIFTIIFFGVFWRKIHSKRSIFIEQKKRLNPFSKKYLKIYANKVKIIFLVTRPKNSIMQLELYFFHKVF